MKVNIVEDLGGKFSFGKDEVNISKIVYEALPEESREDLKALAIEACTRYHNIVNTAKAKGEKVNPMGVKKETLEPVFNWLKRQVDVIPSYKKVTGSSNPRIPSNNETPRVVQKQSYFVDINTTQEDISSVFDNFNSEELSDEQVVSTDSVELDIDNDLFDGDDLLGGLDDF